MNIVGQRHWVATLLVAGLGLAGTAELSARPVTQAGSQGNGVGNQPLGSCHVSDVWYDATHAAAATDCRGYQAGNDTEAAVFPVISAPPAWNMGGPNLALYKDDNIGVGSSNGLFDVVGGDDGDASKGHLRLLQEIDLPFVLTLKGGNEWAAYYFPALAHGYAAGTRFDFDIPGTQGAGLSHASVVVDPPAPDTRSVPEPGSLLLVLGALGALGGAAATRRRRAR